MTHLIPETSLKRDRAVRFGRALDRAMKRRDVGRRPLAEAIGASGGAITMWRSGRGLPRLATAQKLAAALDDEGLVTLLMELRAKRCLVDDVEFVDDTGSDNRQYCTPSCQRVAEKKRLGSTREHRAARAERQLTIHQRSVADYCRGCEPGGRCVTPECALRPVSPLPLFEERVEVDLVQSRRRNRWEGSHEADAERQTAVWARYSAEERQARIDRAAEASKRARGLVAS